MKTLRGEKDWATWSASDSTTIVFSQFLLKCFLSLRMYYHGKIYYIVLVVSHFLLRFLSSFFMCIPFVILVERNCQFKCQWARQLSVSVWKFLHPKIFSAILITLRLHCQWQTSSSSWSAVIFLQFNSSYLKSDWNVWTWCQKIHYSRVLWI